jgi:predicted enzyme related to lactoylglutathione lyase
MPNPVTHFEITGKDGEALKKYYGDLFGWSIDSNNSMNYGMISAQDNRGAGGGISATQDGGPGMVTVYVEVSSVQEYLDKAVALGGKVLMPAMAVPDGPTIGMFADPEGHVIGLSEDM